MPPRTCSHAEGYAVEWGMVNTTIGSPLLLPALAGSGRACALKGQGEVHGVVAAAVPHALRCVHAFLRIGSSFIHDGLY